MTDDVAAVARILVVDDDARNLRLAVAMLEHAGYEALTADGGAAGVALARARRPDLVLMDVQMPGVDGFAALRELRADPRTRAIKIAAFTAHAMRGDAERMLAAGFDACFEKPLRMQAFLAQVARIVGGATS